MKKVFLTALSFLLLTSCAQNETPSEESTTRKEIKITAGLNAYVTRAAESTKALPANQDNVFSVLAMKTSPSEDPQSPNEELYFAPTHINSGDLSALTFESPRFYPTLESDTLHFYAFAPSVSPENFTANQEAKFVIDGSQDILWAKNENKFTVTSVETPSLNLEHKLMKISFAVKADDASFSGKITSITVNGVKTNLTLNTLTGNTTWGGETTNVTAFTGDTDITTVLSPLPNGIFIEPTNTINISVVAGGITYDNQAITLPELGDESREGKSHQISLIFYSKQLSVNSAVTNWENGGNASHDIHL